MSHPGNPITPERRALYYVGMALSGVGLLLFLSVFVMGAMNFGNFQNFEGRARSSMGRAFGGIVLIIAGGALSRIGARGWAGSGLILNPRRARRDVEPWSRMAGGMAQDALSEIEIVAKVADRLNNEAPAPPQPQIKIRCSGCQALNDESAHYCDQCGTKL